MMSSNMTELHVIAPKAIMSNRTSKRGHKVKLHSFAVFFFFHRSLDLRALNILHVIHHLFLDYMLLAFFFLPFYNNESPLNLKSS